MEEGLPGFGDGGEDEAKLGELGGAAAVLEGIEVAGFGAGAGAAATFVFCSVPEPVNGLQEVRRVVRDGGRVHLLEHVRARNPIVGRLMDLANPIAVRLSGANINRDTVSNVEKAGIALDAVESRGFGILKLIRGSAGP